MEALKEEIMLKYLRGRCSDEEATIVNEWLGKSPDNIKDLFETELALDMLRRIRVSDPESIMSKAEKRLMERIRNYERSISDIKRKRRKLKLVSWYASIAVVFLAVIVTVIFSGRVFNNSDVISVRAIEQVKHIVLPDGTNVWLNQASLLQYSINYSLSERSVYLDGEAFFDVVKNTSSPFIVNSDAISVKVLGTTFNMKAYADSPMAEATLLLGEIEIKGNNNEGQIVLMPGQKAQVNTNTKRMTVKSVNAPLDAVWRDNLIPFNESSIKDIAKVLEQFYKVKIIIMPGVNDVSSYSGVIRKKDSIEEVLKLLTNAIPIRYTINGNTIYIGPNNK